MEANPQTEKRTSNKEKKGFTNTPSPAGLFNAFALDPSCAPFPTPSGSAPQRVQTLERKLDLQKCLNRLKSDDHTLNNAFASAQRSIDSLVKIYPPPPHEKSQEETNLPANRAHALFDWKRVSLEFSAWQKELALLDQNRCLIQDKIKASCQTIGSSLNTLEKDYRKAITDREQEKLNLTEQLGKSNLPYERVKEIREKIADINQQEAGYFQNLNTTIFSAEALSKASKQLTEKAQQLTSETKQAIQTLKRQSVSPLPKMVSKQVAQPSPEIKPAQTKPAKTTKTERSNSEKSAQLSELLESIQQYRTEIEALKKDNHTLTDDYQRLKSEQVKSYQFSDHLKQDTDSLKCETEALRISNQLLSSDIKESRKENLQLSKQYAGQHTDLITKKELKQLFLDRDNEDEIRDEQRYEQLESNHINLAQNIQKIESSLGQSLQDQSALSDIALQLKDQTESSRCETQRLESEIQHLKLNAEELSSTLKPLKHSHENQQEENRSIQNNLAQQQKTTEQQQKTTAQQQKTTAQQQIIIEKQNQKSQQLAERINEKLRSNSALAHQLIALKDNLNTSLETSKSSYQESTQTLQEQKQTNQSAIDLIERLEHNQQQQRHTQTALNQQLKTINQTIQDSEIEKQALTQSLKIFDTRQLDLLESIQQANEVSGELQKAQQAQTKSLLYIDTQHHRADQLTLDLTELKLFAQNVVNKNRTLTEDFSAQLTQIKNKTEQISELEKTVLNQLDNTYTLHRQNDALYKKSDALHEKNETLAEQLEHASDQLGESHHQHQQLLSQQQQQLHTHQEQLQNHQAQRQEQLQVHQNKHQEQLQTHQNKHQEQHQDHQEQHQRQLLAQSHLQNQSTQLADDLQNQLKCVEISLSESSQKAKQLDQLYEASHTLNDKTNQLIDTQQFLNSESQRIQNETLSELEDIRTNKAELIALQGTLEQTLQGAQQQQQLQLENSKNAYAEQEQNHQQALQGLKTTKHQHQKSIQESRVQQQQTHKQLEQIQQIQQQYHRQVEQLQNKITDTEKALKESRRIAEQTQESFDNSATVQQSYQHTIETFNQTQLSYIKAIDTMQRQASPFQHQPPHQSQHQSPQTPSNQSAQHPQSIPPLVQASLQPSRQDFHWEMPAANQNQAPVPWYKAPQGILLAVVLLVSLISSALVVLNQINRVTPPNGSIKSHLSFNPKYPTEINQTTLSTQQTTELLQASTVETLLALIMSNQSTPTQTKTALETILKRPESEPLHHWVRQELKSLQRTPVRSEQLGKNGFVKKQFNQAPSDHVPSFTWPLKKLHPDPASITYARFRQGITITAGQGHPIVSISDGKVIFSGQDMLGTGSLILIQHPDQYISVYGNSRSLAVALGEQVKKGQVIAQIGDHYQANAPSLYFEIRYQGNPEDPFYYFSNT